MQGVQNNRDCLWDIPLTWDPYPQTTIIPDNAKTSTHHAGLYTTNIKPSLQQQIKETIRPSDQEYPFICEFEELNNLIDDIRDNQFINQQHK